LIVSFAGSYLREIGGWIAVADLIRCLDVIQLTEPSVRQALARLKSRGFLAAEKRGRDAGYRLTGAGLDDLTSGDRRIFRHTQAALSDGWVLAVFSVPEADRHLRHQLRAELARLGFGTVSPGVWIAPRPLAESARSLLTTAGLDRYVTWFAAQQLSEVDVSAWWDLTALREKYDAFLAGFRQELGVGTVPTITDDQALASYLRLVDEWRLFPRLDPGLPESLVPPDWPAAEAWLIFRTLHARWAAAGLRHVQSVITIGRRTVGNQTFSH